MENEIKEYARNEYGDLYVVLNKYERGQFGEICVQLGDFKTKEFAGEQWERHLKIGNIIDLIQCGDYVNGKEVIMDLQKSKEWYKSKDDFITCKDYTFEENEIKTVVTKEQFESISYKV